MEGVRRERWVKRRKISKEEGGNDGKQVEKR